MSSGTERGRQQVSSASTLYLTGEAASAATARLEMGLELAAAHVSRELKQQQTARRGVHPDVMVLEAASSRGKIGIDQVRAILRAAQFVPEQGERRVCLIPQAERLTAQAANGLLKVLEEPPRGMVFVLIAAHAQDVLPTVLSRLRIVRSAAAVTGAGDGGSAEEGGSKPEEALNLDTVDDLDRALADARRAVRARGATCAIEAVERRDRTTAIALARLLAKRDDAEIGRALDALMQRCASILREDIRAERVEVGDARHTRQRRLASMCRTIDEAQRAMWVYTPKEAVLVRLFLAATEEEADT